MLLALLVGGTLLVVGGIVVLIVQGSGDTQRPTLTVYSSLPLQGPQARQSESMVNAMKLALKQAHGRAGRFTVTYRSRDDSTRAAAGFTAAAVSKNATDAARDPRAVGYIGDFNSGATAVSIPILSEAKVAQISPASTAVGLTVKGASSDPGEPESYYYEGFRNFARIVPNDSIQAAALVTLMTEAHCSKLAMINDGSVYGRRLARDMRKTARDHGLPLALDTTIGTRESKLPSLAARRRAGCFLYMGATSDQAVRVFTQIAYALPRARLYAPDGVVETAFTDPNQGGIPPEVAARTTMTVATLGRKSYGSLGNKFFDDYSAEYDDPSPEVYAIYGYEAMSLMLDAIRRSGSGSRADVVTALLKTRDRVSALGNYSIDKNGDTTTRDYGVFRIRAGRPAFLRTIHVP